MSKLAEHIKTTITNKRVVNNNIDFSLLIKEPENFTLNNYLYEVKFDAVFGTKYYVDESHTFNKSPILDEILNQVKRSVIEEVFGEFRGPLYELRHELYKVNANTKIMEKLNSIEKQMFDA